MPQQLHHQDLNLSRQGKKPAYDRLLCRKVAEEKKEWQAQFPDEKVIEKISNHTSSLQIKNLLSFVGEDVMWWARIGDVIDIVTLPRAFHESNYAIDLQLTSCNGNKAAYFFDGHSYVTDLSRGNTPLYIVAAEKIPAIFKRKPLGRYAVYFEHTRAAPENDLTILVDELNAYLTGAQLEIALSDTYLYRGTLKSGRFLSYDGNIEGTADFMLYFLSYIKVVREKSPESYLKIKNSPLFLAHVQRLWLAAEIVFNTAQPYTSENAGIYYVDRDVLGVIYSENYISELDRLGIGHASTIPIKPAK